MMRWFWRRRPSGGYVSNATVDDLERACDRLTAAYEARGERIATLERLLRESCARHGEPLPLAFFLGILERERPAAPGGGE
jgi:hypothetical protein